MVRKTDAGGLRGGRGRTYCLKRTRSETQPTGVVALNMMEIINVSLAGVASRARKLGPDGPGSKGTSISS